MSRHRDVRNLDLEEEFYDDDDGALYDEMQDISEEDQERLNNSLRAVRKELGPNTSIEDQEIKETLWYYYFDEAATIAYLAKTHKLKPKNNQEHLLESARHRPGNPPLARTQHSPQQPAADPKRKIPSLAGLAARTTAAPSSLASLRSSGGSSLKALVTPASSTTSRSGGLSRLSLGSLSSTRPAGSKAAETGPDATEAGSAKATSVVGKALAALKTRVPSPAVKSNSTGTRQNGGIGSLQNISLSQLSSRSEAQKGLSAATKPLLSGLAGQKTVNAATEPGLIAKPVSAKPAVVATVQNAQPSSLASFILNGNSNRQAGPSSGIRTAVVEGIKQEISQILFGIADSADGTKKSKGSDKQSKSQLARDLTFIRQLVVDDCADKSVKPFAFDTPSPDDRVLAAQSRAVGASF
ncbi:hypothetical protein GGF40_001247 [Coemansia sp. RSA 1286]|nr:hypothetical protein GGF40_001247 [Coemansia sp. RSA 1286]